MNKDELLKAVEEKAKEMLVPVMKEFAAEVAKDIVMVSLEEMVADSDNPYDDMLLATFKPFLDAKIKELSK